MKTALRNMTFIFLTVFLFGKTYAQETATTNFFDQIKNYDISTILTTESFLPDDSEDIKDKIIRSEPIGFIGNDYQRFYIHFISIVQNSQNKNEYFIYGKTRVKETIRPFQGVLNIKKAVLIKNGDFPTYKQGFATCEVNLYEDQKQSSTGFITGEMTVGFIIDNKGTFKYDGLMYYADYFSNNDFKGSWTSYKTNVSKKCNWGDYRIPESGDLDNGVGEFMPNSKYFDKGWKYYMLSLYGETEKDTEIGHKKEKEKWWK